MKRFLGGRDMQYCPSVLRPPTPLIPMQLLSRDKLRLHLPLLHHLHRRHLVPCSSKPVASLPTAPCPNHDRLSLTFLRSISHHCHYHRSYLLAPRAIKLAASLPMVPCFNHNRLPPMFLRDASKATHHHQIRLPLLSNHPLHAQLRHCLLARINPGPGPSNQLPLTTPVIWEGHHHLPGRSLLLVLHHSSLRPRYATYKQFLLVSAGWI